MNAPSQATPLAPAELDRLEALLGSAMFHGDAMPLDALQGSLLRRRLRARSDPAFALDARRAGREPGTTRTGSRRRKCSSSLMRFYNQCVRAAGGRGFHAAAVQARRRGRRPRDVVCRLPGRRRSLGARLVRGRAIRTKWTSCCFRSSCSRANCPTRRSANSTPRSGATLVKSCEETIGDAIVEVREYWKVLRNPPTTVRRGSPKTGRNDPCPCGSGKKFKQCCGAPGPAALACRASIARRVASPARGSGASRWPRRARRRALRQENLPPAGYGDAGFGHLLHQRLLSLGRRGSP